MIFNSLSFLVFFVLVFFCYFSLDQKWRNPFILVTSCLFYISFTPAYILVLALLITIDYFAAIKIERAKGKTRLVYLLLSILSASAVLFIFKYFNFLGEVTAQGLGLFGVEYSPTELKFALPIGLSFHTFQSLSYVIEVYRGRQKAEKNYIIFASYVMFFPQLVAGPIERPQNLLHQFYERHTIDYSRISAGLKLTALGLFKKAVVADRLGPIVDPIFANPHNYPGPILVLGVFFFAIQIYCDFAGYSEMAVGLAQILGFRLMSNFDRPYFSMSVGMFWRKWHISLSNWFRDYLYIPLGGARVHGPRWIFNIFVTFLVSGLWHGASWNFLIWGGLNGVLVLIERVGKFRFKGFTFILICFTWIFFRAKNLGTAFSYIDGLTEGWGLKWWPAFSKTPLFGAMLWKAIVAVILLLFIDIFIIKGLESRNILSGQRALVRWLFYYLLVFIIIFYRAENELQFIYFQF